MVTGVADRRSHSGDTMVEGETGGVAEQGIAEHKNARRSEYLNKGKGAAEQAYQDSVSAI